MEIICTKSCLDKDGILYDIGGRYKYYDSKFVFDNLGNKVFDIYSEVGGVDEYKGNGTISFINEHFYTKGKILFTKLVCKDVCKGLNGRIYYKDKCYYYSLKEMHYLPDAEKQYTMYNEDKVFLGYVRYSFINNNFIEWDRCVEDFLEVDELFEKMLFL